MPSAETSLLDRNSPLPLYRQVEAWLRQQVTAGDFSAGDMLPSVKALCGQLGGINHITVRQALGELVREGLIYSVRGRGTFVADRSGKAIRVALVVPNLEDELTREIAFGVQEVLDAREFVAGPNQLHPPRRVATVVLDSRRNSDKEVDNIRHLEDMPLDGAIIMPIPHGDVLKHLERLKRDRFPVVLVDSLVAGIQFPHVAVDNYDGGYRVTEHLLHNGRQHLAWIGSHRTLATSAERFNGFRDALGDFGVPFYRKLAPDLDVATPTSPYEPAVADAIERVLACDVRPDAIVCDNDFEALECLRILRARGIDVPGDIAVTGFDDIRQAQEAVPGLTTVRRPMRRMGEEAAKLMLKSMQPTDAEPATITLPVSLIVRQSSGAATTMITPAG